MAWPDLGVPSVTRAGGQWRRMFRSARRRLLSAVVAGGLTSWLRDVLGEPHALELDNLAALRAARWLSLMRKRCDREINTVIHRFSYC